MGRERDYGGAVDAFERALRWDDKDDYAHHYLAYNLDIQGMEAERVEAHYGAAIALDSTKPWWWSRWINFLITRGRIAEAELAWDEALDAVEPFGPSDTLFGHLHRWVAGLLALRAEVDFARRVLGDIPTPVRRDAEWVGGIERYLRALEAAADQEAVFPLSVPPSKWWEGPHRCARRDAEGRPLTRWLAGRVEAIDDDAVHLTVGEAPSGDEGSPTFGALSIPRVDFDAWTGDETAEELVEGRFVEVAFYGDGEDAGVRIRIHPNEPLAARFLPRQDMDPEPYLRRAGWLASDPTDG